MTDTATPRVLLVEDEPTISVTLCDDLEEQGVRVTHTADGCEAIRFLAELTFDAVITDLRLPGADGLQVVTAARHRQPGCKVMVITAHVADWFEALRRDGTAIVAKPFLNSRVLDWLRVQCPWRTDAVVGS